MESEPEMLYEVVMEGDHDEKFSNSHDFQVWMGEHCLKFYETEEELIAVGVCRVSGAIVSEEGFLVGLLVERKG